MKIENEGVNDAVSPVVGVMLMLVVTIIIAAVVSGFAGGLVRSQEKTPQASIAISTGYVGDHFDIKFEHQGGDPIRTRECQFITFLTLPNGTIVKHVQKPTSPLARSESLTQIGGVAPSYSRGPHLTDPQKYAYPYNPPSNVTLPNGWTILGIDAMPEGNYAWFGNAVWLPGDIARTYNNGFTANFLGLVNTYNATTNAMDPTTEEINQLKECVAKNCKVEIKLLHVPSGKYILDKTIALQG